MTLWLAAGVAFTLLVYRFGWANGVHHEQREAIKRIKRLRALLKEINATL